MTTEKKTQAVVTAEETAIVLTAGYGERAKNLEAGRIIAALVADRTDVAVEAARAEGHRAGLEEAAQVRSLLEAITETFEAAVHHAETKGQGGQSVTFTGDFGHVPPSTVGRMRWWAREFRTALLAAPVEAPRGKWLSGVEVTTTSVNVWPAGDGEPVTVAIGRTVEDAERIAEMLREVGRRLR